MSIWNSIRQIDDINQHVSKFVFSKENAVAEMVLYKYPTYEKRTVVCFSVQAGCPVGCRFCGAGDYFVRSLTTEEIINQVEYAIVKTGIHADKIEKLQLMSMSMGEPLLNLKNLVPAIEQLYIKYPNAALLISTSAPKVNYDDVIDVSKRIPTVGLQFSVHESTDNARNELIPFKSKLSLEEIASEGTRWYKEVGRKPFFNYCAHDTNSNNEDADRILNLFDPSVFCATVSVVCERSEGMPATNDHQRDLATTFANKLVERGFDVRVFDPAGQDTIGGGCGQLHFVQQWFVENPEKAKKSIGNGMPIRHTPKELTV